MSMPHGPALSRMLELLTGFVGGAAAAQWEEWISPEPVTGGTADGMSSSALFDGSLAMLFQVVPGSGSHML
jgi:hypothetical protein